MSSDNDCEEEKLNPPKPEKNPISPLNNTKPEKFMFSQGELDKKTIKKLEKLKEKPLFLKEINEKYSKRRENVQSFHENYKKLKEEKEHLKKLEQNKLDEDAKKIARESIEKRKKDRLKFVNKKKKQEAEREKYL